MNSKARVYGAADSIKPYVERAMTDEKLRSDVMRAVKTANDLYRDNAMVEGNFIVGGQRVDLSKIRQPLLAVAAERDYVVPPACARRLVDAVSSADKEYFQLPGGHISVFSGRQANRTFWPKLDQWLAQRSA